MGCHFQDEVGKGLWFPAEAPSLLLLAQKGSQLLHSELPYGEVHMARNWHLRSTAQRLETCRQSHEGGQECILPPTKP